MIKIDTEKCTGCGGCIDLCPPIAIAMINDIVTIDEENICDYAGGWAYARNKKGG